MGKGSKPRPFSVDQKKFSDNWDAIFNKKVSLDFHESENPLERPYLPSINITSDNGDVIDGGEKKKTEGEEGT